MLPNELHFSCGGVRRSRAIPLLHILRGCAALTPPAATSAGYVAAGSTAAQSPIQRQGPPTGKPYCGNGLDASRGAQPHMDNHSGWRPAVLPVRDPGRCRVRESADGWGPLLPGARSQRSMPGRSAALVTCQEREGREELRPAPLRSSERATASREGGFLETPTQDQDGKRCPAVRLEHPGRTGRGAPSGRSERRGFEPMQTNLAAGRRLVGSLGKTTGEKMAAGENTISSFLGLTT